MNGLILKIVFWCTAIVSLAACGNAEPAIEEEESEQETETVIELEDNDRVYDEGKFNKNSGIASDIYKEFFFTKELLVKNRIESDVVDDNKIAEGNQLPIGTDNLSTPYYMDYRFNMSEEKLDLALILTEGTIVKEEELKEAAFVHLEYDKKNDKLIKVIQENTSGETVDQVDLTEDEWIEVAEKSIQFVDKVH